MYEYNAKLVRLLDADTFDAHVDLGFNISVMYRFRVKDYDAPETWRPSNEKELEHGKRATEFATKILTESFIIKSYGIGIYGRYSADVTLSDGRDFVTVMKENKFEKLNNYDTHARK
jgi:endonuclease YncB( thermonuclease family)